MCDGEGAAMCGEPRVAAECTCTAREFGRCSRPTVRPGRNVNDERDHGDGSSTRSHGRGTRPPGRECDGRDAAGARDPPLPRSPPQSPWRRVARADETRDRRPDVGLRASLRQMVMP